MEMTVKPPIMNRSSSARAEISRSPTVSLLGTMLLCAVLAGCGHVHKGIPVEFGKRVRMNSPAQQPPDPESRA